MYPVCLPGVVIAKYFVSLPGIVTASILSVCLVLWLPSVFSVCLVLWLPSILSVCLVLWLQVSCQFAWFCDYQVSCQFAWCRDCKYLVSLPSFVIAKYLVSLPGIVIASILSVCFVLCGQFTLFSSFDMIEISLEMLGHSVLLMSWILCIHLSHNFFSHRSSSFLMGIYWNSVFIMNCCQVDHTFGLVAYLLSIRCF